MESEDAVFRELQELLSEPETLGSKDGSGAPSKSEPKVGMSSKKGKKSGSYPKIADSRNYTYDEIIECQESSSTAILPPFSSSQSPELTFCPAS